MTAKAMPRWRLKCFRILLLDNMALMLCCVALQGVVVEQLLVLDVCRQSEQLGPG